MPLITRGSERILHHGHTQANRLCPTSIDGDTIAAVTRVLQSGWITSGPELAAFEEELASFLAMPHVACFSSWTTACELALRWFGVGR